MRIRIVEKGFERFTGQFGMFEFEDGVSVTDIPAHEIDRIAASVRVEPADDAGRQLGAAARIVEGTDRTAPVLARLATAEELSLADVVAPVAPEVPVGLDGLPTFRTEAELGAIADKGGIKALRKIGDEWNVKGRAIDELVRDIVKAQDDYRKKRGLATGGVADEPSAVLAGSVAHEGTVTPAALAALAVPPMADAVTAAVAAIATTSVDAAAVASVSIVNAAATHAADASSSAAEAE